MKRNLVNSIYVSLYYQHKKCWYKCFFSAWLFLLMWLFTHNLSYHNYNAYEVYRTSSGEHLFCWKSISFFHKNSFCPPPHQSPIAVCTLWHALHIMFFPVLVFKMICLPRSKQSLHYVPNKHEGRLNTCKSKTKIMIFYHQKGLDFNFMTKTYGDMLAELRKIWPLNYRKFRWTKTLLCKDRKPVLNKHQILSKLCMKKKQGKLEGFCIPWYIVYKCLP